MIQVDLSQQSSPNSEVMKQIIQFHEGQRPFHQNTSWNPECHPQICQSSQFGQWGVTRLFSLPTTRRAASTPHGISHCIPHHIQQSITHGTAHPPWHCPLHSLITSLMASHFLSHPTRHHPLHCPPPSLTASPMASLITLLIISHRVGLVSQPSLWLSPNRVESATFFSTNKWHQNASMLLPKGKVRRTKKWD